MPTPEEILRGLDEIAHNWRWLAILWHGYFGALVVLTLALGKRPTRRIAGLCLAPPLFSVSALAWWSGNFFNGTAFVLSGIALAMIAATLPGETRSGPPWALASGGLLLAFGWVYPHFFKASSWLSYLHAAPTGLIPCPTLASVIGLALIADGLGSRASSLVLGAMGFFYGIFGAVRLGVTIDLVLIGGALLIVLLPWSWKRAGARDPS